MFVPDHLVAGTQTYVRKLESRLLSARHGVELQQRCMQQKAQLDALAHALAEAEACGAEAQAAAQAAQLDVACLKRGLELAAEQLTKSAGAEVPGTLLRAVARVRHYSGTVPHEQILYWICSSKLAVAAWWPFLHRWCLPPRPACFHAACVVKAVLRSAARPHVTTPPILLQGQEEALGLSVQLSDAKQQVAQLTAALEQARAHLQVGRGSRGQAGRQASA